MNEKVVCFGKEVREVLMEEVGFSFQHDLSIAFGSMVVVEELLKGKGHEKSTEGNEGQTFKELKEVT